MTVMEDDPPSDRARLTLIQRVRCLECGAVYGKPGSGRVAESNPGCPVCGYVGWAAANVPVTRNAFQRRFAADHRPRRLA
jgi:hypothetical protein